MNLLDSGVIVVLNPSNEAALALFNKTTTALLKYENNNIKVKFLTHLTLAF